MGRFMARDYVTIREEPSGAGYVETSVGRARLKSAPGQVTRKGGDYRIYGAAWGRPIAKVEVRIDDGPWREATIDRTNDAPYAWKIWTLDWPNPSPGEHRITSCATDAQGNVQPAMTDPVMANKKTYWETFGQVSRTVRIA
jgi:peptidoglycan/xylan/chitin deacetylase (PgdA/CDA1 family)